MQHAHVVLQLPDITVTGHGSPQSGGLEIAASMVHTVKCTPTREIKNHTGSTVLGHRSPVASLESLRGRKGHELHTATVPETRMYICEHVYDSGVTHKITKVRTRDEHEKTICDFLLEDA
jgi:hypothetical protein